MKEKTGFILYIDILGYKDMLRKNTVEGDERIQKILNQFTQTFSKIDFSLCFGQGYDENKLFRKFFSDNFLFLYESEENNFNDFMNFQGVASQIQYQFLLVGILTRGALTYGKIYYNDDIIYGLDLIKAVEMEENHREPSVVVDRRFKPLVEHNTLEFCDTIDLFCTHAESKPDFEDCVNGIRRYIENLNKSNVSEQALAKIKWVIKELNDYFGAKQKVCYELKNDFKYSLVAKKEGEI